jgi:hypothetical protein
MIETGVVASGCAEGTTGSCIANPAILLITDPAIYI